MFAGGTVRVGADLRLGDVVRREAWIAGVTEKTGRQGDLVVVRVASRLVRADGEVAVSETQDLLYRDASSPAATASPVPEPMPVVPTLLDRLAPGHWRFRTDPTKLMRFSSATGNGHRIHYDWPYATGVEGYPGLVVHGPLMTLAVAEVARLEGLRVQEITHRNRSPLFCGRAAGIRLLPGTGPRRELVLAREDDPALPYTTLAVSVAGGRPLTPSAAPGE
jgi:3-methylfumaryl-CoA hydratase